MKTENPIDGKFREGLPDVGLPPPPTQDWASMARAARTNAVLAGKSRSASMTSRWAKILGGAAALTVGASLYFGQLADVPPEQATSVVTAQKAPPDPVVLVDSVVEVRSTATEENVPGVGTIGSAPSGERSRGTVPDEVPIVAQKTAQRDRPADMTARTPLSAAPKALALDAGPIGPTAVVVDEDAAGPESSSPTATLLSDRTPAVPPASSALAEGANTERRIHLLRLAVLPSLPSALPYVPTSAHNQGMDDYTSFARWSIAPWVSVGKAVVTDPDHGTGMPEGIVHSGLPTSAGVRVQYTFDPRLAFITGIGISQKGSVEGSVASSSAIRTDYQLSGRYIEMPLALKFIRPIGGLETYARAGLTLQFNRPDASNKVVMQDDDLEQRSTLVLAGGSMGSAIDIGIGVQFRLGHHLGLFVEPGYQYMLSQAVKHPSFDRLPFNPRIHTFSVATGLSYQFR